MSHAEDENGLHDQNPPVKCDYCGGDCEHVPNKEIYGKNYGNSYMIWLCRKCDAYVGCHNNTESPLGRLSNRELRKAKMDAKNLFIKKHLGGSWNCPRHIKTGAYSMLAKKLGIRVEDCHFGHFDLGTCNRIKKLLS